MPIYEYLCSRCGAVSEYLIGVGREEPIQCKRCRASSMKRILSATAVALPSPQRSAGSTCCGREERCERPPCSDGGGCRRG
jgi:putative FmdB family regulatory protein